MASELEVISRSAGFTTIVSVRGDVDLSTRTDFAEAVLPVAQSVERLVLDLTEVAFIDSLGISELVRVRRALQHRGQGMHVVPSRRVLAALKLASMTEVMKLYDSVNDALLDGDVEEPA